jgi:hypothetical protein
MNKLNSLALAGIAALALTLGVGKVAAQPGPGGGGGNFDPAAFQQQMQQRMTDYIRQQLAVTNDDDWKVIEPRLAKVTQLRMETMLGGMGGFRGMMGNRGGGGGGGMRGLSALAPSSPEADALQKAIDDNAPAGQVKAALEKVREARKLKAAALAKAQEQLRQVLTIRQEAVMVSMSMLE